MEFEIQKSDRLVELAQILSQQNDYEEILRLVTQKAAQLLGAEVALILMINPRTRQTVKTVYREGVEFESRQFRAVRTHIGGWIMKKKETFISLDIRKDLRVKNERFKKIPTISALGVPLRVEGLVMGALILLKKPGKQKSIEKESLYLEQLAAVVAPYLRNVQKIQQYFETPLPEEALLTKYEKVGLLGKSPKFINLLKAVEAAARSDVRVLLEGQSGTGKELIAKAIHQFSARGQQPFVAIDCGAIPAQLLESELFGYAKGAFTGATTDRKGLLQEADQGTLFMDEINNLPYDMQSKLMRVLQEGEIRPLGSNKTHRINVRIITASSNSLKELISEQKFREDLFYRLYVYPITVPSLKDSKEDIPLLAHHFLRKFASQQKKQAESFHEELSEFMKARKWHGNIRELENFIERLVTLATQEVKVVSSDILPKELKKEMNKLADVIHEKYISNSLSESLADFEERLIRKALINHDWNQSKAARALKIPVQTLRYRMGKLGIEKPG